MKYATKSIVISIGAALICANAFSAQWQKEPTSIFGLKIGESFTESSIRKCPYGGGADIEETVCSPKDSIPKNGHIDLDGTPNIGIEYSLLATIKESKLIRVSIIGKQKQWAELKALLVEKYGKPTKSTLDKVTTRAGATFTSEQLMWTGRRISVTASQRVGDIDTSVVSFDDNDNLRQELEAERQQAKGAASKL